jgi:prepilin-type processing-associated H-X9-DG protein
VTVASNTYCRWYNLKRYRNLSSMIVFGDSFDPNYDARQYGAEKIGRPISQVREVSSSTPPGNRFLLSAHANGNFLFMDFHVEAHSKRATFENGGATDGNPNSGSRRR